MKAEALKARFEAKVCDPLNPEHVRKLGRKARRWRGFVGKRNRVDIAAALAHAAFLAPGRIAETYDAFAEGWLGEAIGAGPIANPSAPSPAPPTDLWSSYWAVAEDAIAGELDAGAITERTAALGGMMGEDYLAATAAASRAYPGVAAIDGAAPPARVTLDTLATCPEGSLGRDFHALIVDNKFDLEVLDREAIGLADLPPPLDYLNTRILQAHDLWHIVAGYETTALHEIAISAFQMAQFGHAYSAQFLAVMGAVGTLGPGIGYPVLMTTIATAWVHGRRTPPMITIDWEQEWAKSAEAIRDEYGIAPYVRPYPADLIEKRVGA